jgi:hypothetical protein
MNRKFSILTFARRSLPLMVFLLLGAARALAQEAFVMPEKYPLSRYPDLLDKSPFAQAAPLQDVSKDQFAKDFVIVSHYRLNGVIHVNLMDRKSKKVIAATSDGDPSAGFKVVSLIASANPWLVQAVLEKDGQRGSVGFDIPDFENDAAKTSLTAATQPVSGGEAIQRTSIRHRDGD